MSGLFGYISASYANLAVDVTAQMGERLRHQPYLRIESHAPEKRVACGYVGLGLINSDPKPVCSTDGKIWLWLCGELYHVTGDHARLALATYLDAGSKGLCKLEGAFLIAVWDGYTGQFWLVNDRFGLYPLYYAYVPQYFSFAPEIKAVLCAPTVPRCLDTTAIAQYMRFQQLLGERTWFEDVRLLSPASLVCYVPNTNSLSIIRYWDWDRIEQHKGITFDEAVEEVGRLFQRAVDAMSAPPLRAGVYLSGGLDGRTILGFLRDPKATTTITYGAPGCRDVVYAKRIARCVGSQHRWFPLHDGCWVADYAQLHLILTEGMHGWINSHGMSTLQEARQLIDVNLSGWDGGTILGGLIDTYATDKALRYAPDELTLVQRNYDGFCQRFTWPGLTNVEFEALLGNGDPLELRERAYESFFAEFQRTRHYPTDRRSDYFYLLQRVRRSTQNMVVFTRSAIEVRCPFFDYAFIDFVYGLPEAIRTTPALYRSMLTRRAPRLAFVPYDKDNRLPHSNWVMREAHGLIYRSRRWMNHHVLPMFHDQPRLYADYEHYLRTDLRDWAETILFGQPTRERGLFDQHAVRALWDRHLSGNELWTIGKIAPLITIEQVIRSLY